jgi:hypothetical protein
MQSFLPMLPGSSDLVDLILIESQYASYFEKAEVCSTAVIASVLYLLYYYIYYYYDDDDDYFASIFSPKYTSAFCFCIRR